MKIDELQKLFNHREKILYKIDYYNNELKRLEAQIEENVGEMNGLQVLFTRRDSVCDELESLTYELKKLEAQIEELMPSKTVKPSTRSTLLKAFSKTEQVSICGRRPFC